MARLTNWENQIGPRLRLRDLHVLFMVSERGSMARAAAELGISQPAVSDVIANLECTLGVRLFDRSPRGVETTIYGRALLRRSLAAFDELKQGIRDIEFLSDPTAGELRIGSGVTLSATILPSIIHRFSQQYPRVILHVDEVPPPTRDLSGLRDREHDLILGRWVMPIPHEPPDNDLSVEFLFDDPLIVAAGNRARWASRRKVDLAELIDEPWILSPPNTWNYMGVSEAFRSRGLVMPKISVLSSSLHVPVELPARPWPVAIVTLKNRTLSPVVDRFVECAREVAKTIVGSATSDMTHRRKPDVS